MARTTRTTDPHSLLPEVEVRLPSAGLHGHTQRHRLPQIYRDELPEPVLGPLESLGAATARLHEAAARKRTAADRLGDAATADRLAEDEALAAGRELDEPGANAQAAEVEHERRHREHAAAARACQAAQAELVEAVRAVRAEWVPEARGRLRAAVAGFEEAPHDRERAVELDRLVAVATFAADFPSPGWDTHGAGTLARWEQAHAMMQAAAAPELVHLDRREEYEREEAAQAARGDRELVGEPS